MPSEYQRPNPEQLLAELQREERRKLRGRLKVFLGYSGGVGKSFQMFDEGRRRHERGEDVVVCALQPEYPPEVQNILQQLEIIPLVSVGGVESIDVPAVIARRPQVALIDGLAYDNSPEAPHAHRWQDVEEILEAGISIVTTVNMQYLEKHQDEIERITGKHASTAIPLGFLDRAADEIVVVDAPAAQSVRKEDASPDQLVRQQKLSRLRELALLVAAGVVDRQLEAYLRSQGVDQSWGVQERILVCVTERLDAEEMLESGRRNADRFQGGFFVVYVQASEPSALPEENRLILERNLECSRRLGATVEVLKSANAAEAILTFAKQHGITQIVVGHSTARRDGWRRFRSNPVDRLIRSAEGIDVIVYPLESASSSSTKDTPAEFGAAGTAAGAAEAEDAAAAPRPTPGRMKLFLGYAAGVGKTYRMLEEAQQLQREGKDVVIGYFEPHARKDTMAKTIGLEAIPTRSINYRGVVLKEMDTPAVHARHPAICVVDELAHTNVPGSERPKRWEDVQTMLEAGIDVLTTMNIQHLESLNDHIFRITGVRVRETVPDWMVKNAQEIVMVDATTEALLNRLKRGKIYSVDKAKQAMDNFFKESTLAGLRELAMRQTAHELEAREIGDPDCFKMPAGAAGAARAARDRVMIYATAEPATSMLIRRGSRMADYLGGHCFAVSVSSPGDKRPEEAAEIEKHLKFAKNLHIETRMLEGADPAHTIVDFASHNCITQILLCRPESRPWSRLLGDDLILRIVREARDVRVIVVADRRQSA